MGMIHIGTGTYGSPTRRGNANTITIGNYCSIAEGVILDSGFNHDISMVSTYPFHRLNSSITSNIEAPKDIYIGNDVWIGEGALIMAGAFISDGAVIGARSVVTKNTIIHPYEVWAGGPAKFLGCRLPSSVEVAAMLHIKWWDWEYEKIMENAQLLNSRNIREFINMHYKK